ncbi:MAG: DUF4249 family protein [Williamsia sp.]|nr:DUF4249 family protein [Williamsia sp.]
MQLFASLRSYSLLLVLGGGCVCFLTAFASCKKPMLGGQFVDDRLVILAEVSAGDSMEVPVGKTIKAGSGNLIGFQKVNDATVTIAEGSGAGWMLRPNWSAQFASNPNTVFTNRRRFRQDSSYLIEVKHPVLGTATATTRIPFFPKITQFDTLPELYQGKQVLETTLTWQDDLTHDNYYVIEALKELLTTGNHFFYRGVRYSLETQQGKTLYERVKNTPGVQLYKDTLSQNKFLRLNLYTQDKTTENDRIDDLSHPFRRLFFEDAGFNGRSHTTQALIDRQFFAASDPKQKGRVLLQVKSVSKELFDYLLTYEIYKTDFGAFSANQLSSPVGNVQNGLGIFGGSAKWERVFYFDAL